MSGLILPPGVRSVDRPVDKPFRCLLCGESFPLHQQGLWMQHVAACAVEHESLIHDARPSVRNAGSIYDPESWDVEYEEWLRGIGRKMLREGRLERKPNEC